MNHTYQLSIRIKKIGSLQNIGYFIFFLSLGSLFARDTSALSKNTEKQILNEK